ncbi:PREDICTED: uncharacterized protein LOC105567678, partial [Vollenhovia emeryi]|uniref:uncharacterized protein LOC105567678 n=1 Tax=Vollenhovia emeryi TaxID=411798 RepID=UPI0005F48F55
MIAPPPVSRANNRPEQPPINIIQSNKLRLPTIEIPKFDGSWEKWLPFRDTFSSMLHGNDTLPHIDKLHYLRWALVGDAHKLIESLEVIGDNYLIAWEIINDRYKGNKAIVQHHVRALINLPNLSKESYSSLRQLVDMTQQHTRTLTRLGQPTESWDTLLIQLLLPKLDGNTRREWESERANKEDLPDMEEFISFLETRCSFLEALSRTSTLIVSIAKNAGGHSKHQSNKPSNQMQAHVTTETTTCPVCQNTHKIYSCLIFRDMSVQARVERIKSLKLCYNCLKPFHGKKCTYGSCKKCNKYHNTLIHADRTDDSNETTSITKKNIAATGQNVPLSEEGQKASELNVGNTQNVTNVLASHHNRDASCVLLSTAIIYMRDNTGKIHECRALLDSGAQPNFITRELGERLKQPLYNTDTKITGITMNSSIVGQQTDATIYSRFNKFETRLSFLVVDNITDKIPATSIGVDSLQIPKNIKLADPRFHIPGKIQLSRSQPVFQKTKLGWVIAGRVANPQQAVNAAQCHIAQQSTLQGQLEKFWKIEELDSRTHLTEQEQACEEHFYQTHTRDRQGRFVVRMPLKDNYVQLGDSYDTAKRRLLTLERKLAKQLPLKQQYDAFMHEYLKLEHMKILSRTDSELQQPRSHEITYYLPHHAVMKEGSETTRLRVVFDASAKTSTGLSLNDVQLVGPTIQQDLFSIMMRFRQHTYAISADISKITEQEIDTYELQTVTYGEACSAFLATRALHQAALDLQQRYPEAAEIIIRDFYVDDLLTGDNDIE